MIQEILRRQGRVNAEWNGLPFYLCEERSCPRFKGFKNLKEHLMNTHYVDSLAIAYEERSYPNEKLIRDS